jgi:hypothetical protein
MLFDPFRGRMSLVGNGFSIAILSQWDKEFSILAMLDMTEAAELLQFLKYFPSKFFQAWVTSAHK